MNLDNSNNTVSSVSQTEVFALTDEQIVGLDAPPDPSTATGPSSQTEPTAHPPVAHPVKGEAPIAANESSVQAAPAWLAERMQDPHHGEAAKALWDAKQKADTEIAAYRESFATAADARALKDLYPGGLAEAQSAAQRARELDAIDAAFYRGDSTSRTQLAQRLMQQDPTAFREMVEAGVRLLSTRTAPIGQSSASQKLAAVSSNSQNPINSPTQAPVILGESEGSLFDQQLAQNYAQFEKAANADLEQTVGGAISRVMEEALPNLRLTSASSREGAQAASSLRDRLTTAVREEVDSALRSDQELGAQVSRILAGKRFDDNARAQVVRVIDARAQQLIPAAVRRVVSSWTQATLGTRSKRESVPASNQPPPTHANRAKPQEAKAPSRAQRALDEWESPPVRPRRLDYARFTDEQILGL